MPILSLFVGCILCLEKSWVLSGFTIFLVALSILRRVWSRYYKCFCTLVFYIWQCRSGFVYKKLWGNSKRIINALVFVWSGFTKQGLFCDLLLLWQVMLIDEAISNVPFDMMSYGKFKHISCWRACGILRPNFLGIWHSHYYLNNTYLCAFHAFSTTVASWAD